MELIFIIEDYLDKNNSINRDEIDINMILKILQITSDVPILQINDRHINITYTSGDYFEAESIHPYNIVFNQRKCVEIIFWTIVGGLAAIPTDNDKITLATLAAIISILKDFHKGVVSKVFNQDEAKVLFSIYLINKPQFTELEIIESFKNRFPKEIDSIKVKDIVSDLLYLNFLTFSGSYYRLTESIKSVKHKYDNR